MNNTVILHRLNSAFLKQTNALGSLKNEVQNAVIDAGFNLQAGAHPNHVLGRLHDQLTNLQFRQGVKGLKTEHAAVDLLDASLDTIV